MWGRMASGSAPRARGRPADSRLCTAVFQATRASNIAGRDGENAGPRRLEVAVHRHDQPPARLQLTGSESRRSGLRAHAGAPPIRIDWMMPAPSLITTR